MGPLRFLNENARLANQSLERLATGKRINRGSDDPAGLISAERLSAEIRALEAETESFERLSNAMAVAESSFSQVGDLAQDMKAAAMALANSGGLSDAEREAYQMELDSLASQAERFGQEGLKRLENLGLDSDTIAAARAEFESALSDLQAIKSGGKHAPGLGSSEAAMGAIDALVGAGASLAGAMGAHVRDNLEPSIRSNQKSIEELTASRSTIQDTDYAEETSRLNQAQVKYAGSVKVLKMANHRQAAILDLLSSLQS